MSIEFDVEMMFPKIISPDHWDSLLELEIIPNSDNSTFIGKFSKEKKGTLKEDKEPHPFAFNPVVTNLTA